jgi:hypothetical protein
MPIASHGGLFFFGLLWTLNCYQASTQETSILSCRMIKVKWLPFVWQCTVLHEAGTTFL